MKIYVYGNAHSGTTILRKIIGDHSLVDEVTIETRTPPEYKIKPHIVFKFSDLPDKTHKNCKRVMIVKNPWDVIGSIEKRREFPNDPTGLVDAYYRWFEHYLSTEDFKIRYEDMVKDPKPIFEYLGLEYEGVKNDRKSEFSIGSEIHLQSEVINKLAKLRTYQINLPFQDMTGNSAKYLSKHAACLILQNPLHKHYSDYLYLSPV